MHHARGLRRLLEQSNDFETEQQIELLIDCLKQDFRKAELSAPDLAMLEYSVKLTKQPQDIVRADVELLREQGFDDRAIHDLVCCVSYFAFVNRIADGLGVELE